MYFHFPPKYQENFSWNSSTCCGNPDSMRNQLWSSAVSGWGFSDLGDWKLPAVTETGAGWSCFSQGRAGHLDIFLLGKEVSLPPPEYLDNTEVLTPPWLENLPECWCFSSKLRTLSVSVKRRIKCLPQYPREINIHKLSAMFLDAWPAGKAGTGCGAFPEGLLMKTNFFFFLVHARNQILNIVVENPNDLGSSNKTSWCLVIAVLFDPSLLPLPVSGSGVMPGPSHGNVLRMFSRRKIAVRANNIVWKKVSFSAEKT